MAIYHVPTNMRPFKKPSQSASARASVATFAIESAQAEAGGRSRLMSIMSTDSDNDLRSEEPPLENNELIKTGMYAFYDMRNPTKSHKMDWPTNRSLQS